MLCQPLMQGSHIYITAQKKIQADSAAIEKPAYVPGRERWSLYKSIWLRHWPGFQTEALPEYEQRYGTLSAGKRNAVERLIKCGDFNQSLTRYECSHCGLVHIVPFSCKSRLCLSCYRKKLFGWSTRLPQILEPQWHHLHLTWTIPGRLRHILFERQFEHQIMNRIAAGVYQRLARKYGCKSRDPYWQAGILSTVHTCGNGLNYNPHVHSIVSRELVHTKTGELIAPGFLPYVPFRKAWRDALLRVLVRRKFISMAESCQFKQRYPKGFTVHFQPIDNKADPKTLYRTAQYLASGYFHNSQILKVDHDKMRVTFRHRTHLNARTREKRYATVTLSIYEFMSRMLFYLPEQHQKAVRYYGIYAANKRKSRVLQPTSAGTWAAGIENSFQANPKKCPDCKTWMQAVIFFKYQSYKLTRRLSQEYKLHFDGYYRPIRGP